MARKFAFSTSFDIAEREPDTTPVVTPADVEQARADGLREGRAAAIAEAESSVAAATRDLLGELRVSLNAIGEDIAAHKATIEAEAVATVLAIVRKLVPHYAETHAFDEIRNLVTDCLAAAYEEPRIVVRVSDDMLDPLRSEIDTLVAGSAFGGKVVLFPDATLQATDCRVEWADGGTERNVTRLSAEIDSVLVRFLNETEGPAAGASGATGSPLPGDKNG